ncbi:MAG: hypothetical protein K0R39_3868 [Symbiobacteriaceae bacterium]|jgi:hypothetical protein|nr:hypothetical protein [Symbiobacteriaceae bacterium]
MSGLVASILLILLSLVMGVRLLRQYSARPRPHTLWYAVGLLLTALAAFPEFYIRLTNGLVTPLWWLYWVAASALVGYLAVGTAYLISPTAGKVTLTAISLLTLWLAIATVMTAGPAPDTTTVETLSRAPNGTIKLPFALQSSIGGMLILFGALWSYYKTRYVSNLYIALGALFFSAGGALAGLVAFPGVFALTQSAGIIALYVGVTQSGGQHRSSSTTLAQ